MKMGTPHLDRAPQLHSKFTIIIEYRNVERAQLKLVGLIDVKGIGVAQPIWS